MQQLKANLAQVPEVRQERVAALSQAVSSGAYQVSDQQLSDAIGSDLLGKVVGSFGDPRIRWTTRHRQRVGSAFATLTRSSDCLEESWTTWLLHQRSGPPMTEGEHRSNLYDAPEGREKVAAACAKAKKLTLTRPGPATDHQIDVLA